MLESTKIIWVKQVKHAMSIRGLYNNFVPKFPFTGDNSLK